VIASITILILNFFISKVLPRRSKAADMIRIVDVP